jgi:glutathione synthase/RimK-type ligase-like ATP-grasp enzyme
VILAVTHPDDDHAAPVLESLKRLSADVAVLDLADLPGRVDLSLGFGTQSGAEASVRLVGGRTVRADEIEAVWWRRTRPFATHPGLTARHAGFAERQTFEAVEGFFASLKARFVNHPHLDRLASHKPLQLATAQAVGLAVPATLVTNDPRRARAFLAGLGGRAVHKALHATPVDWRPTRWVGPGDLTRLDAVRLAPVILQAFVPGVDVRVFAVGHEVFAAEIDARKSRSPEDFRTAYDECPVRAVELPEAVRAQLLEVMRRLGLAYGAFDLRRGEDGRYLFLEVNPSGLWGFVEERTKQPIGAAVARLLTGA